MASETAPPSGIPKEPYKLFFGFDVICKCKKSQKFLGKQQHGHKQLSQSLMQLSSFFIGKVNSTLDIKGESTPCEYQKWKGGKSPSTHKFELSEQYSVLVREEPDEEQKKLFVHLVKAGDLHPKHKK